MFMPAMDPKAQLHAVLAALDDQSAAQVLAEALRRRPELAPGVVSAAVPDLTYAPADALSKRRSSGVVKSFSAQGFGFISCPELKAVFGHDVYVHRHQIGPFVPGSEVSFAVLLSKSLKPQAFDLQPASSAWGGDGCGGMGSAMGKDGCGKGDGSKGCCGKGDGGKGKDGWGKGAWGKGAWGKEAWGKDGSGKDSWGKDGWGKDGWGKDGWGKDGWGKDGGKDGWGKGAWGKGSWGKEPWGKGGAWGKAGGDWPGAWAEQGPAKRPKTLSPDAKPDVQQVLGQFTGTIKSFNASNGFGFIQCELLQQQGYQNDVYLHHSQIGDFQPGHTVLFTAYLNKKGQPQAMELQAADWCTA